MRPAMVPADPVPMALQNARDASQQNPSRAPLVLMAVAPAAKGSTSEGFNEPSAANLVMQLAAHGPGLFPQPTWIQV